MLNLPKFSQLKLGVVTPTLEQFGAIVDVFFFFFKLQKKLKSTVPSTMWVMERANRGEGHFWHVSNRCNYVLP